jgi:hypothetical protein
MCMYVCMYIWLCNKIMYLCTNEIRYNLRPEWLHCWRVHWAWSSDLECGWLPMSANIIHMTYCIRSYRNVNMKYIYLYLGPYVHIHTYIRTYIHTYIIHIYIHTWTERQRVCKHACKPLYNWWLLRESTFAWRSIRPLRWQPCGPALQTTYI